MGLFSYSQGTADWELLKSMSEEDLREAGVDLEELEKAMNREGMTQKEVQVTRNGRTFTRKQWVKTGQGDSKNKETNKVKHVVNKDNKKSEPAKDEKTEKNKDLTKKPVKDVDGNEVKPGDEVTWAAHSKSGKPLKRPNKGKYLGLEKAPSGNMLPIVERTSGKKKGQRQYLEAKNMNSSITM